MAKTIRMGLECCPPSQRIGFKVKDDLLQPSYRPDVGESSIIRHNTPQGTIAIIAKPIENGLTLLTWSLNGPEYEIGAFHLSCANAVACVGDAMAIACADGLTYAYWTGEGYAILGHTPQIPDVAFGLRKATTLSITGSFAVPEHMASAYGQTPGQASATHCSTAQESYDRLSAQRAILSALSAAIDSQAHAKGLFWAPFWVCCAYRMKDGTRICATEPVLMRPWMLTPLLPIAGVEAAGDSCLITFSGASMPLFSLRMRLHQAIPESWKRFIDSIDIFMSVPVSTYLSTPSIPAGILPYCDMAAWSGSDHRGRSGDDIFVGNWAESSDNFSDHYLSGLGLDRTFAWALLPNPDLLSTLENCREFRHVASVGLEAVVDYENFFDVPIACSSPNAIKSCEPLMAYDSPSILPSAILSHAGRLVVAGAEADNDVLRHSIFTSLHGNPFAMESTIDCDGAPISALVPEYATSGGRSDAKFPIYAFSESSIWSLSCCKKGYSSSLAIYAANTLRIDCGCMTPYGVAFICDCGIAMLEKSKASFLIRWSDMKLSDLWHALPHTDQLAELCAISSFQAPTYCPGNAAIAYCAEQNSLVVRPDSSGDLSLIYDFAAKDWHWICPNSNRAIALFGPYEIESKNMAANIALSSIAPPYSYAVFSSTDGRFWNLSSSSICHCHPAIRPKAKYMAIAIVKCL